MKESCKETFLLERLFQGKFSPCKILARCLAEKCINLQDLARKSCKILVRNAFFFNQGRVLPHENHVHLYSLCPSGAFW